MSRFRVIVIGLLLAVVVLLGAVVVLLVQRDGTGTVPAPGQSAALEASGGEESVIPEETPDELDASVRLGALQIVGGETFGLREGDAADCETAAEDGVYTVSASTTRDTPLVVTVPEGESFDRTALTASGGSLSAEELDVQELYVACEQGSLRFSGRVSGDVEVEHLQGETVLELAGDPSEFNYEVSYELGHVQIGTQSYAGAKGSQSIDNGSEKTIRVHCAMGSVEIVFPEATA